MISSLKLKNFRKFKDITFTFHTNISIIFGDNAKGKSTLLEALHIISNGVSPWNDYLDIFNQDIEDKYFSIESIQDDTKYLFFRDHTKRNLKIDDKGTNSKKFFQNKRAIIFSPELIEILMISPSKRREYLDNHIVFLDREYGYALKKYNRVLTHRNRFIKKLSKTFYETGIVPPYDNEMEIWSDTLAKLNWEIVRKRGEILNRLSNENIQIKYISDTKDNEDITKELRENFKKDIALGYTTVGCHKDDWEIVTDKRVKQYGSRGEKRVAIIKMIFSFNLLYKEILNIEPILILDDVPSELDTQHTKEVLEEAVNTNQQLFISVIDIKNIPKNIVDMAQIIHLD